MPSLGADMDEGTLVEWLVAPGDHVHRGQVVAVVDTSKSAIEVEVFEDAVIEALLVDPGTTVPVGAPLARLDTAGASAGPEGVLAAEHADEAAGAPVAAMAAVGAPSRPTAVAARVPPTVRHLAHERGVDLESLHGTGPEGAVTRADVEAAARAAAPRTPAAEATPAAHTPAPATKTTRRRRPAAARGRVAASPYARRLAAERGVDLGALHGTGPDGTVRAEDVLAAATAESPAPPAAPPADTATAPPAAAPGVAPATEPDRGRAGREPGRSRALAPVPLTAEGAGDDRAAAMRAAIATLMSRSAREIPHYYLQTTIDLGPALAWLREHNADRPPAARVVPAALLLKASAAAARKVPQANGFVVDDVFRPAEHVHLGVAISLRAGGLVAPAIHDADTRDVDDLMAALKDLVARARAGRLRGSEMADPTITVTNLGDQGAGLVHGVIYAPQVALVGFGRIVERPWAVDGMLTVRPVVTATLAADHRVTDGHTGGLFLAAVDAALRDPGSW